TYQLDNLQNIALISNALATQKFLLPTLWFLILVTTITLIHSRRTLTQMWLALGWIHWILLVVIAHRVLGSWFDGYPTNFNVGVFWIFSALFSLWFNAVPMSVWGLWNLLTRYGRAVLPITVTVVLASLAYILPLLLWTQDTIPRYYVAAILSLLLTGCVLWASYTHYKDKLPARYEPEKSKRKPKEEM